MEYKSPKALTYMAILVGMIAIIWVTYSNNDNKNSINNEQNQVIQTQEQAKNNEITPTVSEGLKEARNYASHVEYMEDSSKYNGTYYSFDLPEGWKMWEEPNNASHIIINSDTHYNTYHVTLMPKYIKFDQFKQYVASDYRSISKTVENYKKISSRYFKASDKREAHEMIYSSSYKNVTYINCEYRIDDDNNIVNINFKVPQNLYKAEKLSIDIFMKAFISKSLGQ